MAEILGIDVGGSGIKAALVNTENGDLVGERHRVDTPQPSTPANMAAAIKELVSGFDYAGRIGCCFPAVIHDGIARTAGNIDDAWLGTRVDHVFSKATGKSFAVVNDADAAGIAEMELGAGKGLDGLVITLTIGTGIGSGVFYDGTLIPNIEIGWMTGKDGDPIEAFAGDRARKIDKLSWDDWGHRFNYFLERTTRVFFPDHYILGGGASKKFDRYRDAIRVDVPIHIASFLNNAGIVGAAMHADRVEHSGEQ